MKKTALVSRKTKTFKDHLIYGVAEVPSNMSRWDSAVYELEHHLMQGMVHVLTDAHLDWVYLNTLKARACTFAPGLATYVDGKHQINYRYLVLKGSIPFSLSFEEARYANDSQANFSCVFPSS